MYPTIRGDKSSDIEVQLKIWEKEYHISDQQWTCPCLCKLRRLGQVMVTKPCTFGGYDIMQASSRSRDEPIKDKWSTYYWHSAGWLGAPLMVNHQSLHHLLTILVVVLTSCYWVSAILYFLPIVWYYSSILLRCFGDLNPSMNSEDLAQPVTDRKGWHQKTSVWIGTCPIIRGKFHFKTRNTPMGKFDADREVIYLIDDTLVMMSGHLLTWLHVKTWQNKEVEEWWPRRWVSQVR